MGPTQQYGPWIHLIYLYIKLPIVYWPLILMALCIIDFIGANGLLGPVGGRGPRSVQGPLPLTGPRNPFAPMKSIIHGAIKNHRSINSYYLFSSEPRRMPEMWHTRSLHMRTFWLPTGPSTIHYKLTSFSRSCGSGIFIPDPGSKRSRIPDLDPQQRV